MFFRKRLERKVDALTAMLVRIENKLDEKGSVKSDAGTSDKDKLTSVELVNKWRNGEGDDKWTM